MSETCWFAKLPGAGGCEGQLVACHLISKHRLKREFARGVWRPSESKPWRPIKRGEGDDRLANDEATG